MIVVIDNFDSFTYNLVQYLGENQKEIKVFRNNAFSLEEIENLDSERIVISPGPGRPKKAGLSLLLVEKLAGKIPMLGVCLGHQVIGKVFGAEIIQAAQPMHGKYSFIYHNGKTIFKNIASPFEAIRYHSLIIKRENLPSCLEIIAETKEKEIMGVKHRKYPIFGIQFHPESIFTKEGKKLLKNFLEI